MDSYAIQFLHFDTLLIKALILINLYRIDRLICTFFMQPFTQLGKDYIF